MASPLAKHVADEAADEVLAQRAASLAMQVEEDAPHDMSAFLLVRVAQEWLALPLGRVREILQGYTPSEVPCVPEFVLGVINVRGEILSVTDLARLMSVASSARTEIVRPILVVISEGPVATALLVDEVGAIEEVPSSSLEPPVSTLDKRQAEFVCGSVVIGESVMGLLDVGRILEPVGSVRRQ